MLGANLIAQNATPGDKTAASRIANISVCTCGAANPKYRGYCRDCLMRLKATFDRYMERFNQMHEEYEHYTV